MTTIIQIIGFASAVLTTCAFLPQAIKTWRTKSTDDLSPLMFALFFFGIIGWLFYGIFRSDLPMILANSVTICLAGIIMYFILSSDNTSKISHLGMVVDDLEKMKDFYVSSFKARSGNRYSNPTKGFTSYFITFSSGVRLELMHHEKKAIKGSDRQWGHIALSTGSKKAVDSLFVSFKSEGLDIISEPRHTGDGYYEFIIADPEKNRIKITI